MNRDMQKIFNKFNNQESVKRVFYLENDEAHIFTINYNSGKKWIHKIEKGGHIYE